MMPSQALVSRIVGVEKVSGLSHLVSQIGNGRIRVPVWSGTSWTRPAMAGLV